MLLSFWMSATPPQPTAVVELETTLTFGVHRPATRLLESNRMEHEQSMQAR